MKAWADRFRKRESPPRRRHLRYLYSHKSAGCGACGAELFAHKPDSYYGHIPHAYKKR